MNWTIEQREPDSGNPSGLELSDGHEAVTVNSRGALDLHGSGAAVPANMVAQLLDRWRVWQSRECVREGRVMESNPVTDIVAIRNLLADHGVGSAAGHHVVAKVCELCKRLKRATGGGTAERDDHTARENTALRARCARQRRELRRLNGKIALVTAERNKARGDRTFTVECSGAQITYHTAPEPVEPLPAGWAVGTDSDGGAVALWKDTDETSGGTEFGWCLAAWIREDGTEDSDMTAPEPVLGALRAQHKALGWPCPWEAPAVEPADETPPLYECGTCRHDSDEPCDRCDRCDGLNVTERGGWEPKTETVHPRVKPAASVNREWHREGCAYRGADPPAFACTTCDAGDNRVTVDADDEKPESCPDPGYTAPDETSGGAVILTTDEYANILDRLAALEMGGAPQ